jgi:hypothetical protein
MIGAATQRKEVLMDPMRLEEVHLNIAPFAHVAVAGRDNAAPAAPKSNAAAAEVPATGDK